MVTRSVRMNRQLWQTDSPKHDAFTDSQVAKV